MRERLPSANRRSVIGVRGGFYCTLLGTLLIIHLVAIFFAKGYHLPEGFETDAAHTQVTHTHLCFKGYHLLISPFSGRTPA